MELNKKRALEIRRKREAEKITRLENGVSSSTTTLVTPASVKLTSDQRKLIEMKRQQALEIRKRKLFKEDNVQPPPGQKRPPADASLVTSATKKQRVDDTIKVKSEDKDQVQPPSARKRPPEEVASAPVRIKSEEKKSSETKKPPAKKKKPRPTKKEAAERRRSRLEEQGRNRTFDFGTYNRRTFAEVAREDPTYHERYMHKLKQEGQTPRRTLTQYINWFNNTGGMTAERQIRSRYVRTISERQREEAAEEREYARASGDYFDAEDFAWKNGDAFLYDGRY